MFNHIMKAMFATALAMMVTSVSAEKLPDPLVIATEGAYPPFNYVDSDGNVQGFEIDLANALCDELNANCKFITQDWDGIIPGLLAGKYDVVIASLYITEARRKKIAFSDKYYQTPARFVVPKDSDIEINEKGLSGLTVGTQRGTSFARMMRDKYPSVELRVYGSMPEVYQDLVTGRVDLAIDDVVSAKSNLLDRESGEAYEFRGPEFTNPKWFGHGAGVAVRKEDAYIAEAFSEAIAAIRKDGTYEDIADEWFGFDVYGN